jgi:hypothetical protein
MQGTKQILNVGVIVVKVWRDSQVAVTAGNHDVVLGQAGYQAIVIAGPKGNHRRVT